jgi:hypothetical protein
MSESVHYEICEPCERRVAQEWERRNADVIVDAQKGHEYPKLISQNIANKHAKVVEPQERHRDGHG